jgi:hypothetical protein
VEAIDHLIYALENVRDGVLAMDKDTGLETLTIFSAEFMNRYGHSQKVVSHAFPILEGLRDRIQAGDFEGADPIVLALLARFRQVREARLRTTKG